MTPGFRLLAYTQLGSTSDEARRLAKGGAEEGTIVWAREQTAGRGRLGRSWQSPPGNLYCSLVLRPACPPRRVAELGFAAAVGLGDALAKLLPPRAGIQFKWPNDVLVNGRKIAGILLETETVAGAPAFVVMGIGVNIAAHPGDAAFPATSLAAEGVVTSVEALLEAFIAECAVWLARWQAEGFEPVRNAWLARAWRLGEEVEVRGAGTQRRGRFLSIDAEGGMLLDGPTGRERVSAGDVAYGPA